MRKLAAILLILAGVVILATAAALYFDILHIWEDGSWGIGHFPYILKGCLPGGLCNL